MKKFVGMSLVTLALLAGAPATGSADGKASFARQRVAAAQHGRSQQAHQNKWRRWQHQKGVPVTSVPELDPGAAAQAFALLLAATALLIERRRVARG
jgi:hypothetical protein